MANKFNDLYQIYNLTTPSDLRGKLKLGFGVQEDEELIKILQDLFVVTNAGGAWSFKEIKENLKSYCNTPKASEGTSSSKEHVSEIVSLIDLEGSAIDELGYWRASSPVKDDKPNKKVKADKVSAIIPGIEDKLPKGTNVGVALLRTPFVNPATRGTNECDLFLNYMPPLVVSRLAPYLSVEFQKNRDDTSNRPHGLMKFLLGSEENYTAQDTAMIKANAYTEWKEGKNGQGDANKKFAYAGMEMFTSPQTLVNMDNLTAGNLRYLDVLDPFRPLMSLDNVSINDVPAGASTFSYRRAKMQLKLHDKSRVTEIAELITPKRYKDVVIWITYGWLAPKDEGNEYFDFINNNMLRREAFKIMNTAFALDNTGQMTLTIELYTQGSSPVLSTSIIDDDLTSTKNLIQLMDKIKEDQGKIEGLQKKPEGINTDIRIYQILDAAGARTLPDMDPQEAKRAIDAFEKGAKGKTGGASAQEQEIINKLRELTKAKGNKYDYQVEIKNEATNKTKQKFDELLNGLDPFLPQDKKTDSKNVYYDDLLLKQVSEYNKDPTVVTKNKEFNKKVVSFGKLFLSFMVKPLLTNEDIDELQVVFYAMNEQCGPVSLHSIAEFPIDVPQLQDQYRDHVAKRGGEQFTLQEFMQLVINSQFLDRRAIGYGLRTYYEPYDPDNQEAKEAPGKQLEQGLNAMILKYGGFKLPNIVIYAETMNVNNAQNGKGKSRAALIDQLEVSDKVRILENKSRSDKTTRILRLHVYDSQLSPYRGVESIVKVPNNNGTFSFAYVSDDEIKSELVARRQASKMPMKDVLKTITKQYNVSAQESEIEGKKLADDVMQDGKILKSYRFVGVGGPSFVREQLSNKVPSIVIGTNGSLVTNASLSSKMDPLNSTVNMQKNERIQNKVSPNGSGDFGLPMRVVPASLTLTSMGCPLAMLAQQYYIDFGTGTTLDNLYVANGITHNFAPGKYETSWNFVYSDAYGRYIGAQSLEDRLKDLAKSTQKSQLEEEKKKEEQKKSK